jgi:cell division protein FtsW (lipid II flippase)
MRLAPRARPVELLGLAIGVSYGVVALHLLDTVRGTPPPGTLTSAVSAGAAFMLAHLALVVRGRTTDQLLLPLASALSMTGLVMAHRLGPETLPELDLPGRQLRWLWLGVLVVLLILELPSNLRFLRRYQYTWALVGIAPVALALLFGYNPSGQGPRLWLKFGRLVFQPSELLKPVLVMFLAGYLEDKRELLSQAVSRVGRLRLPPLPYVAPLLAMWLLSMALLAAQSDLGAALLLFGVFLSMLYLASQRPAYVMVGLLAFALGAYQVLQRVAYARLRLDVWLDPWRDAQASGYQIVHGLITFASGGVLGTGLGYGLPASVPASQTDYPLAAVVEEMGMASGLAILTLYALLILRGLRIASTASSTYDCLLACGLTTALGLQSLLIVFGNLRVMPLTGMTLPLISYGGSSMITTFASLGLLLHISQRSVQPGHGPR